ncbi:cytochrome C551 [Candidatus Marinamargulisbacteria bacterium SCGC AG-343-D04]|nr:cytochrome C551 [Candidatus Marinamargulisbacteria bacterium SCGC AG-343-D04]
MTTEEQPHIFARQSRHLNLDPGVYFFCNCGRSQDGIFCDGAHKGTSFGPKRFKIESPRSVSLCQCKYSKNKPYCDGEHRQLPKD